MTGVLCHQGRIIHLVPKKLISHVHDGHVANAFVSVTAADETPSGFTYSFTSPETVSVTVSVYATLVVAAAKTQKRSFSVQPLSTLTISSQLSRLKK